MKRTLFFTLIFLASQSAFALPNGMIAFKEMRPIQGHWSSQTEFKYFLSDFDLENEDADEDIDDVDYESTSVKQIFFYGYRDDLVFYGGASYSIKGSRKRVLDDDVPLDPMSSDIRGLNYVEAGMIKSFEQLEGQGVEQGFVFSTQSGFLTAKDNNSSLGSTDLQARYLFAFNQSWGDYFGSLSTYYFGKKELLRVDGETQVREPYSAVSLWLGARLKGEKSYIAIMGGFGLMTDYVIESPSYSRAANHGFQTRGALLSGYRFDKLALELRYIVGSDVFNKSGELLGDEIDYELETQKVSLAVLWHF